MNFGLRVFILGIGFAVGAGCSRDSATSGTNATASGSSGHAATQTTQTTTTAAAANAPTNTGAQAPGTPTAQTSESSADPLVGQRAPDLTLTLHDGKTLRLADQKGKVTVLYFYPKDETPGCTKEAWGFRDTWESAVKANITVIGISTDSVESHKAFAEHHHLPFSLVSDPDGSISKQFGVPLKNGMCARQTIVIGKDGTIKKAYRNVDVGVHANQILEDAKQ